MTRVSAGSLTFVVHTREGQREWVAWAERADTGDRFGLEWSGSTEAEAIERAAQWLIWQQDHEAALTSLQTAERAYHRAITEAAFGSETIDGNGEPGEPGRSSAPATDLQKELLERINAERVKLDAIRGQRPA